MTRLLPEEEEYAGVDEDPVLPSAVALGAAARDLLALAFGGAVILGAMFIIFLVAYALTRWSTLLLLNIGVAILAIVSFVYLQYRRSKLVLGP